MMGAAGAAQAAVEGAATPVPTSAATRAKDAPAVAMATFFPRIAMTVISCDAGITAWAVVLDVPASRINRRGRLLKNC
jgi:hypothetical protein